MKPEVWKPLKSIPRYSISNYGRVLDKETGEKVIPSVQPGKRYQYVDLDDNGQMKSYRVDILVMDTFKPRDHEGMKLVHKDENRFNHFVDNLEWKHTYKNLEDFYSHQKVKDVETGIVYESVDDCAKALGLKRSRIKQCLGSERLRTGGKRFKPVD